MKKKTAEQKLHKKRKFTNNLVRTKIYKRLRNEWTDELSESGCWLLLVRTADTRMADEWIDERIWRTNERIVVEDERSTVVVEDERSTAVVEDRRSTVVVEEVRTQAAVVEDERSMRRTIDETNGRGWEG